ncbi:glycosyltransferase [bacterium]|nr:MAG: glycosyltransferase [bacterium]
MLSIIITAWREEKTIGNLISCILNPTFLNYFQDNFELILACPDDETYNAAMYEIKMLSSRVDSTKWRTGGLENNFIHIKDEKKGKPAALNQCFKIAKGEFLFLTDGDLTYLSENAIVDLHNKLKSNDKLGAVTGHPISADEKNTLFGYWGNLLADTANEVRVRKSESNKFFPVSGYNFMMRNFKLELPSEVLSDDAWMSYKIKELGFEIGYEEKALCKIKYPQNMKDWYKQKVRSLGGYVQLHELGIINSANKSRSFWGEIALATYPIKYAKNVKEFIWSLLLYPTRLWLWIKIFWERKIIKKSFAKTWVRVESTK